MSADTELFLVSRSSAANNSSVVIGRCVTFRHKPFNLIHAGRPERRLRSDMP